MGREANVKSERRQLRLIIKEEMPRILESESLLAAAKQLAPLITERLDQIASATEAELKKLDGQANTFRGYMMRELGAQLSEELGNISGTMLGWQRALTKRLGITDMNTFDAEVQAEKEAILLELKAEAQLKADKEAAEAQAKAAQEAAGKAAAEQGAGPRASSDSTGVPTDSVGTDASPSGTPEVVPATETPEDPALG